MIGDRASEFLAEVKKKLFYQILAAEWIYRKVEEFFNLYQYPRIAHTS